VKFLIDNNLSPQAAVLLGEAGQSTPDDVVLGEDFVRVRPLPI
jgi:hypothetical protein